MRIGRSIQDDHRHHFRRTVKMGEEGQSIVLIALVFVVLLAFTALAVDAGLIFVRSSQFSRAVDAAALAGVIDLKPTAPTAQEQTGTADDRARQFLAANGWPNSNIVSEMSLSASGLPQYMMTASWPVDFFFARLIGLDQFDITHTATAAYYSRGEIAAQSTGIGGHIRESSLFNVGRDGCTKIGDPIHPLRADANPDVPNLYYTDFDGVYRYRIQIPDTYTATDIVRVELFDPDSHNLVSGNSALITHTFIASYTFGLTETLSCSSGGDGDSCVIRTGESLDAAFENPLWFLRVDETWNSSCDPDFGNPTGDTTNTYELYYLDDDGDREPLARYSVDNSDSTLTDLQWVVPGYTPGVDASLNTFDINIATVPVIPENGFKHVYLDVTSEGGSSKNVWNIRAGPPPAQYTGPSVSELEKDVNKRNLQIANQPAPYDTDGIFIEALGYMPVQYHIDNDSITVDLSHIGVDLARSAAYIRHFDYDSSSPPPVINFTFDTFQFDPTNPSVPLVLQATIVAANPDPLLYQATCDNGSNCDNSWSYPVYALEIPGNYRGGTVEATFIPHKDAFVWSSSVVAGRPVLTD